MECSSSSSMSAGRRNSGSGEEDSVCWICLEGPSTSNPLERPCACPRDVHLRCLGRWCLQQAGRSEERHCRFCKHTLPDWKSVLTPPQLQPADPIMVVTLGDVVHRVRVRPGEDGQRQFQAEIRRLFQIPDEVEFEVTFRCRAPCTADTIQLEGMTSYDAATHCASLMAAQRQASAPSHTSHTAQQHASHPGQHNTHDSQSDHGRQGAAMEAQGHSQQGGNQGGVGMSHQSQGAGSPTRSGSSSEGVPPVCATATTHAPGVHGFGCAPVSPSVLPPAAPHSPMSQHPAAHHMSQQQYAAAVSQQQYAAAVSQQQYGQYAHMQEQYAAMAQQQQQYEPPMSPFYHAPHHQPMTIDQEMAEAFGAAPAPTPLPLRRSPRNHAATARC